MRRGDAPPCVERRSKERGGEWMGGSTHQDASSASDPLKLSSSSALPGSVAEAEALGIVCGQEPPCHLTAEPLSVAVGFPKLRGIPGWPRLCKKVLGAFGLRCDEPARARRGPG